MPDPHRRSASFWQVRPTLHLGLALGAFLLPILILAPHLGDDLAGAGGAGLALAARTLGLLPPPGYPLYLIVAHFWLDLVPFGSDPWKLNLLSAFCLGLTSLWLYLCARRLAFAPSVAFAAGLCFALTAAVWRQVAGPSPLLLAFCLLALVCYLASAWLVPLPWGAPSRSVTAFVLSALSALIGGLEPALWAWTAPLLLLTAVWGWSRRLHPVRVLFSALAGLALGGLLPLLYLPWRAFAPSAFVDTQFVPQFAELLRTLSWGLRAAWLGWYLGTGASLVPGAGASAGAALSAFLRSVPLLALVLALFGAGRSLWELLLTPPKFLSGDRERAARLTSGAVPFAALLAVLLFRPRADQAFGLSAAVALFFWVLPALEILHHTLGTPEGHGAKGKPQHPTWVGYAALASLPFLFYLHAAPGLAALPRRAAVAGSTLGSARAFLRALPEKALVVVPEAVWTYPLEWVRRREHLRPDVTLADLSDPWPRSGYGGRRSLEVLGGSHAESLKRRWAFGEYWQEGLAAELAGGRTVFALLRPLSEDPDRRAFLERFAPGPAPESAWFGPLADPPRRVWIYALSLPRPPVPPPEPVPGARGGFPPDLTLRAGWALTPGPQDPSCPVVSLALEWQAGRDLRPGRRRLELRVTRAADEAGPGPATAVWQTSRRLAPDGAAWRAGQRSTAAYHLWSPRALAPGTYRVWVGLHAGDGPRLQAGADRNGAPAYWLPACDFTVAAGVVPAAQGRSTPAAGSNAVPAK
jgi:hypothetical protein